jgi:hypothetical protein
MTVVVNLVVALTTLFAFGYLGYVIIYPEKF